MQLLDGVLLPPAMWRCIEMGHLKLSRSQQAILSRRGAKAGWPDFLILHRGCYGIELKADGGALTKGHWTTAQSGARIWRVGQAEMFPLLAQAGMTIAVCRGLPDVIGALSEWGIPMRRLT